MDGRGVRFRVDRGPRAGIIQRLIEDPLSETLLTTKFSAGDTVLVEPVASKGTGES